MLDLGVRKSVLLVFEELERLLHLFIMRARSFSQNVDTGAAPNEQAIAVEYLMSKEGRCDALLRQSTTLYPDDDNSLCAFLNKVEGDPELHPGCTRCSGQR